MFRVLAIGDVVGKSGRRALRQMLAGLKEQHRIDFVIVNGENAAGGLGLTRDIALELLDLGVDVLTTGNHIWAKAQFKQEIQELDRVVIPANLPDTDNPGPRLYTKGPVAVFQLLGRLFMNPLVKDPFEKADALLERINQPIVIVDFHAEATSEKGALAHYLDGRVSGLFGTHTHVQTSDERVLPKGTGFITDVGMAGCYTGVIGVEPDEVMRTFLTAGGARATPAKGPLSLQGVVFDVDPNTGKCLDIIRVRQDMG